MCRQGYKILLLFRKSIPTMGAHPTSYSVGTVGCFHGVKRADGKGNHPSSASAETKHKWRSPSTPLHLCFHGVQRKQHYLRVVCFLLGNYPASGVYMPPFRNTLFHLHRQVDVSRMN